jgi:tRNA nucleotidyltransferase (CCA-adding enzyme)
MKEILTKIKPNQKERQKFNKVSEVFLKKLNSKLKDAKGIIGGSGAKGTWIANSHDIDIFVTFDYLKFSDKSAELAEILLPMLKKAFPQQNFARVHGSRDYFQTTFQKMGFEIIPILKIAKSEQAINITDVSPLHANWVNQNCKGIKDEIILAKQFCRANKIYGAESYLGGFSGYVLEILISRYKSFENLLTASLSWGIKTTIDVAKHYPRNNIMYELNQSKLQSPLIVIDPVDKNRNAAAALTLEKFMIFKNKAKEYLHAPGPSFFFKKQVSFASLKKENKHNLIFVPVAPFSGKEDIVGVKLVKAYEFMKDKLSVFKLNDSGWEWEGSNAFFYFYVEKLLLPDKIIHSGPPLTMEEHVKQFKKRYKKTYEEHGRIMVKLPNPFPKLEPFVKNLTRDKYLKDKVKTIKEVKVV